jgi:predicted  nucleic acid-binding Zn-ribbon protein
MRFCPFCSAENAIEATHCKTCARRLPPLPARRRKPARSVGVEPRELDEQAPGESPASQAATGPAAAIQAILHPPAQTADTVPGQVPRSLFHRMAPSPAALRRRAPDAELRPEGMPARRTTDRRAEAEPRPDAAPHGGEWPATARPQSAPHAGDPSVSEAATAPVSEAATAPVSEAATAPVSEAAMAPASEAAMAPGSEAAMAPVSEAWPPAGTATEHRAEGHPGDHGYPHAAAHPQHTGYAQVASAPVHGTEPSGQRARTDMVAIPGVPEAGAINAVRYALAVTRARWQRRDAVRSLGEASQQDTAELDQVLGALGKQARDMGPALGLDQPVLGAENAALDQAGERRSRIEQECVALGEQQAEENSAFQAVEAEHQAAMSELEAQMQSAQSELGTLQAQQRGLRDRHKTMERQYRAYLKAADDREQQAAQAAMGESRAGLRQGAEDMRREAKALEPELHDMDSRLAAFELPISQALARVESLQGQLDAQRRSHHDAREGHRYRLAEIDAELSKKSLERSQAEGEIQRRLHALGTLVDLHRPQGEPDSAELAHLYGRIDGLRGAIAARSAEIDRFTAESEAYDRASRTRGFLVLGGGIAAVVLLIIILIALV